MFKYLVDIFLRFISFAIIWWALAEGDLSSWWFAIPVITLVSLFSKKLAPRAFENIKLRGVIKFIPFFLWQSFLGGIDVAQRAFKKTMPLDPVFLKYKFNLPNDRSRIFFTSTVSLLPGTLCSWIEGDEILVHALDKNTDIMHSLKVAEFKVAQIFGYEKNQEGRFE